MFRGMGKWELGAVETEGHTILLLMVGRLGSPAIGGSDKR